MSRSRPPRKALVATSALAALGFALGSGWLGCRRPEVVEPYADRAEPPRLEMASLLSGDSEGFARALEPVPFSFPEDHGAHPDFRTEWWYVTGNLATEAGRRFGYQFTLFRSAVAADEPNRASSWATRQLYMGHLAVTDVGGARLHAFERFARGALGLAGAETDPFRVWAEDWELTGTEAGPPFRLRAQSDDIALDLELEPAKPPVLQGDRGLSQKGGEPGNASYYYAYTRLATSGRVRVGDVDTEVEGSSWFDREWSTSALEPGQQGWDWFALQLDDGSDLMLYQMRRDDGSADSTSSGSLVDAAGAKRALTHGDFHIEPTGGWVSPTTGARYPSGWRLRLPGDEIELTVEPMIRDQELDLSVLYWEGAVWVEGVRAGEAISGVGYVELTGYGPS